MLRSVSMFHRLLRNLVVIIVALGISMFAVTWYGTRQSVKSLSSSIVDHAIGETSSELAQFFGPVTQNLSLAQELGKRGLIGVDQVDLTRELSTAIMREHQQISAVLVADARGREVMTLRQGEDWFVRESRVDEWGRRTRWIEWTESQPQPIESWREVDYDPRDRPWYTGAIERLEERGADVPHWTEPYPFFTTREPGITASISFEALDGSQQVIAFDILLSDISGFTTRLWISENGKVIVSTDDLRVIGLPRDTRFAGAEAQRESLLKRTDELEMEVATSLTRSLRDQPPEQRQPQRMRSDGEVWWGNTEPFRLTPDDVLWISVIVPEDDLLGDVVSLRLWTAILAALAIGLAIERAIALARSYSRPIEQLVEQTDRMSRGDLTPAEPIETNIAEVRRLARSHERMRAGLASLMELERDMQIARQIQQQTFPRQLPDLPGFDIEAWSSPAQATGGDTFDVVGFRKLTAIDPMQTNLLTTERAQCAMFLLADATGHGMGPALNVTQVRAMLRMAVRNQLPLSRIARLINEQLCSDFTDGRFVTVWLAELSVEERQLTMFSAGQAPILYYDASEDVVRVLAADTIPLGIMLEIDTRPGEPLRMGAGDIVAVISDGVFEASNGSGDHFGQERVAELLRRHRGVGADTLLGHLREELSAFTGDRPAEDDRTALIIKRVR